MWALIMWLIVGGLAGWIASKIMGTDAQMGAILNIIVGIVGAFVGGWLLSFIMDINLGSGSWWMTFFTAIVGAVILLWIVGLVTKRR